MGEGIPCTLRRILETQVENVPDEHRTERELIRETFQNSMKDIVATVQPFTSKIKEILNKTNIGKSDKKEAASLLDQIIKIFSDKAPWTLRQFNESASRMETSGKAEVEAYAHQVIVASGIDRLHQLNHSETVDSKSIYDVAENIRCKNKLEIENKDIDTK